MAFAAAMATKAMQVPSWLLELIDQLHHQPDMAWRCLEMLGGILTKWPIGISVSKLQQLQGCDARWITLLFLVAGVCVCVYGLISLQPFLLLDGASWLILN